MPIGTVRPRIWFPVVLLLFATTLPPAARSTLSVCASGCTFNNLQSALNAASSGDTIVLAAGETYVGANTHEQVKGRFEFEALGERVLKGRTSPELMFKLVGEKKA